MDSILYYFGLAALIVTLAVFASRAVITPRDVFRFPTLAALLSLAWVVPQAFALESLRVNDYATEGFWIYLALCFLALALGFRIGRIVHQRREARDPDGAQQRYDIKRLHYACLGLALIGWGSFYLLSGMDQTALGSQYTGQAAFLVLMGKTSAIALCLAALIHARSRSQVALVLGVLIALPMIMTAFSGVRRELLFDIVWLTGGAWLFATRRFPPRAAIIAAAFLGTVIINSAGDLRGYVRSGEGSLLSALTSAETYESFTYFEGDSGKATEIQQAQFDHWWIANTKAYQYGASYWNGLVHLYVPAFIVGSGVKESFKIDPGLTQGAEEAAKVLFHGSTRTGFADTYLNFGYFGFFVFLVIGWIFGLLYGYAAQGGLAGQFFYFVLLSDGLKAITHSTAEFFAAIPFTAILIVAALQFSKMPRRRKLAVPDAGRAPDPRGPSPQSSLKPLTP